MPRYSTSFNSRVANRRASRRRRRRSRRWRRKSTASKALTIARTALRRTDKPTVKEFWYRRPLDLLDTTSATTHHMYWAISQRHPYGCVDQYWNSANQQVVCNKLTYLQYTFPIYGTATYREPRTHTTAPPGYTLSAANRWIRPLGTAVPSSVQTLSLTDDGNVNAFGNNPKLRNIKIWGDIVLAPDTLATENPATQAELDKLAHNPCTMTSESTPEQAWVRIVAVQHFKEHPEERDIQPSDVFKYPISTNMTVADMTAPMNWTYQGFTNEMNEFQWRNNKHDDNRATGSSTTSSGVAGGPDQDTIGSRQCKFAVLKSVQFRLSSVQVNTQYMRTAKVNMTITPKRQRMYFPQEATGVNPGGVLSGITDYNMCANPVHVWIMTSNDSTYWNGAAWQSAGIPGIVYERLNIKANVIADE